MLLGPFFFELLPFAFIVDSVRPVVLFRISSTSLVDAEAFQAVGKQISGVVHSSPCFIAYHTFSFIKEFGRESVSRS